MPQYYIHFSRDYYSSAHENLILPATVSEKLFNDSRRLRRERNSNDIDILEYFSNSQNTPLLNLDLKQSQVTDITLTELLRNHGENLLSLNLTNCYNLTEVINEPVSDIKVPKLHTLNLGNLIKLCDPWLLTVNNKSRSVILHAQEPIEEVLEHENQEDEQHVTFSLFNFFRCCIRSSGSLSGRRIRIVTRPVETRRVLDPSSCTVSFVSGNKSSPSTSKRILTNSFFNLRNFTLHGDCINDKLIYIEVCK